MHPFLGGHPFAFLFMPIEKPLPHCVIQLEQVHCLLKRKFFSRPAQFKLIQIQILYQSACQKSEYTQITIGHSSSFLLSVWVICEYSGLSCSGTVWTQQGTNLLFQMLIFRGLLTELPHMQSEHPDRFPMQYVRLYS